MATYVDEAVVLRRVDYSDSDRILTLLTRDHGKVGVIARGVRRAGSRLAAHTDVFAHCTVQLARGRGELEVLTQAQHCGAPLRLSDPRRQACAGLVAELADRVLEGGHPLDTDHFDLVVTALGACADPTRDPRAATTWFAQTMVNRLGYAPELGVCAVCHTALLEGSHVFSAAAGGLLCPAHGQGDPSGVVLRAPDIKVLRVIAAENADLYWRLRLDSQLLDRLELVVEAELATHLDRRLRSLDVLRALGA